MEDERKQSERGPQNLPARSFSTQELEAVIRRAVELQAGGSARGDEGVSEVDVVRIGQELGLEPAAVRRAMAEVRSGPVEEHGAMVSVIGARTVRASRVLRRPASSVAPLVERYLREMELLVPQRRFPERTRYVRDNSIGASLERVGRTFTRTQQPLNIGQVDVALSPLDGESCLLELSTDLGGTRAGLVGGMLGSSGAIAGAWAATVWATPIMDPLMWLGAPLVAGAFLGMRAIYGSVSRSAQEKLESLLDRVEHNELG